MKKIFSYCLLIAGLHMTTSCNDDTVNLEPIGYTEAGFFESELEFDYVVKGVYHKVGNYYAFQGDPNRVVQAIWLLPSDDLTTRATGFSEEQFSSLNGTNDRLSRFYTISYQAIQRANTVLAKLEEKGDRVFTINPGLKDHYKGEVLFLRAFVNFRLWNIFGTAPVVTKPITTIQEATSVKNSSGTQLLDQAISDLKAASMLLPNSWPSSDMGRVTKNSAYGMLAKALVFRATVTGSNQDYLDAIAEVNKIGSGGAQPRSLVTTGITRQTATGQTIFIPAYARNFSPYDENNSESLFEYQANRSPNNVNSFVPGLDDWAAIGEIGNYVGYFSLLPNWSGDRFYTATQNIYNAYPALDPRRALNFRPNPVFTGTAPNVNKYVGDYVSAPTVGGNLGISIANRRILRLADVLLLKAEAIAMSGGNLNEAINLINQIRERARKSTGNGVPEAVEPANRPLGANKETVLQWIFEERRLELAFEEGHRWFDLRRRHLAASNDIKINLDNWNFYSNIPSTNFENFNIYFPLPNSEVQETALNQNTGY